MIINAWTAIFDMRRVDHLVLRWFYGSIAFVADPQMQGRN